MCENSKIISFALAFSLVFAISAFCLAQEPSEQEGKYVPWTQGMKYTVQEGDTLWDLSQKFFDTPAMWPDLWRQNPHIENPHWLEPGLEITIYAEQGLFFAPEPTPPEPDDLEQAAEEEEEETKPVLPSYHYSLIRQTDFVKKGGVEWLGKIVSIRENLVMASHGSTVYVDLFNKQSFAEGDRFTVWRKERKVPNPFNGKRFNNSLGVHYKSIGQIVCTGFKGDLLMAQVENSYDNVFAGDFLLPYRDLSKNVVYKPSVENLEGRIIATQTKSLMVGEGEVVFIDKGADDGVEPGQVYSIYVDEGIKKKRKEKDVIFFPEYVGDFIVLTVQKDNSTALVREISRALPLGAMFNVRKGVIQ